MKSTVMSRDLYLTDYPTMQPITVASGDIKDVQNSLVFNQLNGKKESVTKIIFHEHLPPNEAYKDHIEVCESVDYVRSRM